MNWKDEVAQFKAQLKTEAPVISTQAIRIGFFGTVGGGKSVTAGICAVGITPQGLIGWVDGEGKRSGWAIDIVSEMAAKHYGGTKDDWKKRFLVIHIDPPFNPLRVVAAMETFEESGCKTIVLDVLSQTWDSAGGYLDLKEDKLSQMAGNDERKRYKSASSAAAQVKPWTHKKLVDKITTSPTNAVLLFQAKQKYNMQTNRPDDFESPIQDSGLTRTAIAVGHVHCNDNGVGGFCNFELGIAKGTKFTHHTILAALPKVDEQFSFRHAEAILRLCGGKPISQGGSGNTGAAGPTKSTATPDNLKALKRTLFGLTDSIHHGDPKALEQYCWDEAIISDNETLAELSEMRLREVIAKIEAKMKEAK